MALDLASSAVQISLALADLAREVARSVVLVRGSRGSSGSGVLWDQPGMIVTNAHVVPGSGAEVTLANGRRVAARVVRRAPALDLAALSIVDAWQPDGLGPAVRPLGVGSPALEPLPARIGRSEDLRVGDLVVAIGNPMGERNAPSLGILASAAQDVLRLAITLRPGNSGGALVNAHGDVVGIPHMVTGSGLALAVSTRTVRQFLTGATADGPEAVRWV